MGCLFPLIGQILVLLCQHAHVASQAHTIITMLGYALLPCMLLLCSILTYRMRLAYAGRCFTHGYYD